MSETDRHKGAASRNGSHLVKLPTVSRDHTAAAGAADVVLFCAAATPRKVAAMRESFMVGGWCFVLKKKKSGGVRWTKVCVWI